MRTGRSSPRHDPVSTPDVRRAFREAPIATLLSTGLGVGLFPWAPGTAGSALAVLLAYLATSTASPAGVHSLIATLGLLMSGLAAGAAAIPITTRAGRALSAKDPGCIVLDEIAGQWIACAAVPLFRYPSAYVHACVWIASFLAFRLFDIWKPGAIRRLQDLPEGRGIVVDDILAGFLAAAITGVLAYLLSSYSPWS
jgi:phosphatidylglycerophosphatase A